MRGLIIGLSLYGMLAAAGTADAQSMTILVNGFSAGSGDEGQTGMEQLAATLRSRTVRDPGPRLEVRVYDWDQRETIRTLIEEIDTQRCLVLIGHSYGGATVIEVAEELNAIPVSIALLVQIDSVGLNDDELPNNVERGVNYSQRSHVLEELEMLLFPDRPQR
ncbi:MAG: alpha/beta hydrolase, partial [Rhodospirillaceae bacterium]|nr:alpha/beta hydrolase [Rhodospirillaceae bacterium]